MLDEAGISVFTLRMHRGIPDPRGLRRLLQIIRRRSPDIIHAQMIHANLLASVVHLFAPDPIIVTSARSLKEGADWRYTAYRMTRGLVDVATAVSPSVAGELVRRRAARPGRIVVVPSGIDPAEHRHDATARAAIRNDLGLGNRFVWLAAGRFVPAKGYPRLIEAFHEVLREFPASALLIAGDGPLESAIRSLVADQGLAAAVQILGRRDDVPALMSAADAYVMSSDWEGLPSALLEAASASLPTVATDVAGNGDIVIDGQTGFLVPAGDTAGLAGGMRRIMRMSPAQRSAIGSAARDRVVSHFDIVNVADSWEAIYRSALERRGGWS